MVFFQNQNQMPLDGVRKSLEDFNPAIEKHMQF